MSSTFMEIIDIINLSLRKNSNLPFPFSLSMAIKAAFMRT